MNAEKSEKTLNCVVEYNYEGNSTVRYGGGKVALTLHEIAHLMNGGCSITFYLNDGKRENKTHFWDRCFRQYREQIEAIRKQYTFDEICAFRPDRIFKTIHQTYPSFKLVYQEE